jgi:hypothetical protein
MIGLVATTILDSGCYIQCIANGDAALERSTVLIQWTIHCIIMAIHCIIVA